MEKFAYDVLSSTYGQLILANVPANVIITLFHKVFLVLIETNKKVDLSKLYDIIKDPRSGNNRGISLLVLSEYLKLTNMIEPEEISQISSVINFSLTNSGLELYLIELLTIFFSKYKIYLNCSSVDDILVSLSKVDSNIRIG